MNRTWNKVLWITLVVLWANHPARAAGVEGTLSPEQVACEERQLARLAYRAATYAVESNLFLWRASPEGGRYQGLVAAGRMQDPTNRKPSRLEDQLAFDLLLKSEEDFLNPQRQRLPQGTLVRRNKASNLGPPVFGYTAVSFDLAPEVPDPTEPQLPLFISGFLFPRAGQADRAARSIVSEGLLTACHNQVSAFDLKMFEILARTVRASTCLAKPSGCIDFTTRFKSYIFRGAEPLTYRMNIVSYGVGCLGDDCSYSEAAVALLFRVTLDDAGRLAGGDVQALPWCTDVGQTGCSYNGSPNYAVYVMPPLRPAVDEQGPAEFRRSARLNLITQHSPHNILQAPINWADLLRDTGWNTGAAGTGAVGAADEIP